MARADADALRRVLNARGLTEEQLAHVVGVPPTHVHRVLANSTTPSVRLMQHVYAEARALDRAAQSQDSTPESVASIAPPSPIAAALAVVQEAMTSQAEASRDVARVVTDAAATYARTVEASIAHSMLASVGKSSGPAPDTHAAALALVTCVQRIPELDGLFAPSIAPPAAALATEPTEERATLEELEADEPVIKEPAAAPSSWPALASASARRPVVIVGGTPIPQAIESLFSAGLRVEWPEVGKHGGDRVVQSIGVRLASGSLSALVFVQGFLQHKHSERLRAAAAASGTPTAYAGTGGKASLAKAMAMIDSSIARRRAS